MRTALVMVVLVACGSSETKAPPEGKAPEKAKAPEAQAPDAQAPAKPKDLGVEMTQLGCGEQTPVIVECEAYVQGNVAYVSLRTETTDDAAARAMAEAVNKLLDVVAPKMASEQRNIATHTLLSSKTAETKIDGFVYRFEKTETQLRYWVEPE